MNGEVQIAVLEERLRAMDKALTLQAIEYDRRLRELNHAHEQAVEVQHTYVTDEVHDRDLTSIRETVVALVAAADKKAEGLALALTEAKETADRRFAASEAFQSKILGAFALAMVFVPVLTGIIVGGVLILVRQVG